MTFPITDMLAYIAADGSGKNFPTGLIAIILIIVSITSGIVSFKLKLKKIRNQKNKAGDAENES